MRVALLTGATSLATHRWVSAELTRRGHRLDDCPSALDDASSAVDVGHALADRWLAAPPDVALALGWEAGLAAQLAARDVDVPVVLRLGRSGRGAGSDSDRLEAALARSSPLVLVRSVHEVQALVERGVARSALHLLPEAVDVDYFSDQGRDPGLSSVHRVAVARPSDGSDRSDLLALLASLPAYEPFLLPGDPARGDDLPAVLRSVDVVVATGDTDGEVSVVLQGMSCGVPTVALDTGTLADVVADGVTGILTSQRVGVTEALRSLLGDPVRRQSMGLAAVDRVRARFATDVVGESLERLLLSVADRELAAAS